MCDRTHSDSCAFRGLTLRVPTRRSQIAVEPSGPSALPACVHLAATHGHCTILRDGRVLLGDARESVDHRLNPLAASDLLGALTADLPTVMVLGPDDGGHAYRVTLGKPAIAGLRVSATPLDYWPEALGPAPSHFRAP